MLLAIDIGNSNIVLGCLNGKEIVREMRMATDLVKTSDQYCAELMSMLQFFEVSRSQIEGTIISSVVPPVLNSFKTAIIKLTGKEPIVVGPGIKTGLNILLDNPAMAGGDLIVAAVAALSEYKPPLLIIDMGTATTMTALDVNGNFLGGSIFPGVKISAEALSGKTAQLPAISLQAPQKAIGRNTVDCMQSGIMMGTAAMLDGMIERMEQELGQTATVVATGGIARFVIPMCKRQMIYDKDLLLKGLAILYENNKRKR